MGRVARQTQRYIEKMISLLLAIIIVGLVLAGAYAVATGAIL